MTSASWAPAISGCFRQNRRSAKNKSVNVSKKERGKAKATKNNQSDKTHKRALVNFRAKIGANLKQKDKK